MNPTRHPFGTTPVGGASVLASRAWAKPMESACRRRRKEAWAGLLTSSLQGPVGRAYSRAGGLRSRRSVLAGAADVRGNPWSMAGRRGQEPGGACSAGVLAGRFLGRLAPSSFARRDAARTRSRDGCATRFLDRRGPDLLRHSRQGPAGRAYPRGAGHGPVPAREDARPTESVGDDVRSPAHASRRRLLQPAPPRPAREDARPTHHRSGDGSSPQAIGFSKRL